jgi:hypothetical protein
MIRDIVAVVDTAVQSATFIDDAAKFADAEGAHMSVVILSSVPSPDYLMTLESCGWLEDFVSRANTAEARIRARHGTIETRIISDEPDTVVEKLGIHARYADLVLFGPEHAYGLPKLRSRAIETVLFASGGPVIIIPDSYAHSTLAHVALGWDASREAARAVREVLPHLAPKARIDVIVVDGASTRGHGSEPGADICRDSPRRSRARRGVLCAGGSGTKGLTRPDRT